jgi:hypothetical protein
MVSEGAQLQRRRCASKTVANPEEGEQDFRQALFLRLLELFSRTRNLLLHPGHRAAG